MKGSDQVDDATESAQGSTESRGRTTSINEAFSLGAVTSAANLASGLVRAKVAALVLGPMGVGMLAEIMQAASIAFMPTSFGIGPALIRNLSVAARNGDKDHADRTFEASFTLTTTILVLAFPLSLGLFWVTLPEYRTVEGFIIAVGAGLWLSVNAGRALFRAPLAAGSLLVPLAKVDLLYALLGLFLVSMGIWIFGMAGQFPAFALAALIPIPLLYSVARRSLNWGNWRLRFRFDQRFSTEALHYGSTVFISGLTMNVVLLAVRGHVGDATMNGFFQAAWAIGFGQFDMLVQSMGNFTNPRLAAADSRAALEAELKSAVSFVIRILLPALLLPLAARDLAVYLAYSSEFAPAAGLLGLVLAGNIPRVQAWPYRAALLFQEKRKLWLISQVALWGSMVVLTVILTPRLGLLAVGWAYILSECVELTLVRAFAWSALGVGGTLRGPLVAIGSTLLLGVLITSEYQTTMVNLGIVVFAMIWSVYNGLHRVLWNRVMSRFR